MRLPLAPRRVRSAGRSRSGVPRASHRRRQRRQRWPECLENRLVLAAGVVISEFLAQNDGGVGALVDEDGAASDWIELHNASTSAQNIGGWYLTDDALQLTKWQLPNQQLAPGERIVVFASGKNRTAPKWHTNFKLDQAGEYLALVEPDGQTIATEFAPNYPHQLGNISYGVLDDTRTTHALVTEASPFKFLVPSDGALGSTWTSETFDDSAWTSSASGGQGPQPIGFDADYVGGVGPTIFVSAIQTNIQSRMHAVNASVYLRTAFGYAGGGDLESLQLRAKYDDGFVAYLNGTEVVRRHAPGAAGEPLGYNAAATGSRPDENAVVFEDIDLTPWGSLLLTGGANVLAIQALNESASDPDFFMSFELRATTVVPGATQYFTTVTPGAPNVPGLLGVVADTKFDGEDGLFRDAGFYTEPFDVSLSTATAGAEIRYTLDGSAPTATTGQVFSGPIHISKTTMLRAAAFKAGYQPSDVDTQTYLFLDQVLRQTGTGLPPYAAWGHAGADWAVDPDIVNNADPASRATTADLLSVPTVSLVMNWNDLFGTGGKGIYIQGAGVPRATSVELLQPNGSAGFSINASVEIQGGTSDDRWKDDKLSMQLKFHNPFGPAKLNYDLFGGEATTSFDTLILDGVLNWSWVHSTDANQRANARYVQDQFVADLQNAAGGFAPHGRYVHLYLNGLYWGMYYLHERPDKTFNADYQGGDKDTWNVIKHNSTTIVDNALNNAPGTTASTDFTALLTAAAADLSVDAKYQAVAARLDIDNFIDYLLVNWYVGNDDWPAKNWYASRQASPDGKWRFHSWDAEHVLKDVNVNRVGQSPHGLHARLALNAGYRQLFADHVQRLLFNGGILTPAAAAASYQARMSEVDSAIRGESARWGDNSETIPRTRANWLTTANALLTGYFPNRTTNVLAQLRTANLMPTLAAPLFSQQGGRIDSGMLLTLSAAAGAQIYYTLDGSEPRLPGGGPAPGAMLYTDAIPLSATTHVRARATNGTIWSALNAATFARDASALRITELMYRPPRPDAGAYLPDDLEFVELQNTGDQPLDVSAARFTHGITFQWPTPTVLAPGQRIVLASNPAALASKYAGISVFGAYTGTLSDSGERLRLEDAIGTPILDFVYHGGWYSLANGAGFSLVAVNPLASPPEWERQAAWRPSQWLAGNPGAGDAGLPPGAIRINEVLAHSSGPDGDKIELFNAGSIAADIGNWWISNDAQSPQKFHIPVGTMIAAGDYLVFTEAADFGNLANARAVVPFSLSSLGDTVLLTSTAPDGNLAGYREDKDFGPSALDVSFGVHQKSTGGTDFPAQAGASFGAANLGPALGPVVISELMYAPPSGMDEFIELQNITLASVPLYDPAHPAAAWRFTKGVSFLFPAGAMLNAGAYALVTPLAPDVFRAKYAIPASVALFGPYTGVLSNSGEKLELSRPGIPLGAVTPDIVVDAVDYNDVSPWPSLPALRLGHSLGRIGPDAYGNDAASWRANVFGGTPGAANLAADTTPPTIPGELSSNLVSPTRVDLAWTASTDAESGVAYYRVYRNGRPIATAAANSFVDTTQTPGVNVYQVSAVNADRLESPLSAVSAVAPFTIVSAVETAANKVLVTFSEALSNATASQIANYLIEGATISAVSTAPGNPTVTLTTAAPLTPGQTYRITVGPNLSSVSGKKAAAGTQAFLIPGPGAGLLAEYFSDSAFGTKVLTRTDATIDFDFGAGAPAPELPADNFSVRWTGQVRSQSAELYTFYVASDEGVRVWLDGALVVDHATPHALAEDTFQVSMLPAERHDLRIDYFELSGSAAARLSWSSGGITKRIVPATQLYAPPTLLVGDASAVASNTGATVLYVPVYLTAPLSQPVVFEYSTADGTAQAGRDYTPVSGRVTIAAGAQLQTLAVPILPDTVPQPSQSFQLTLFNVVGAAVARGQANHTIVPAPSLSVDDPSLIETDAGFTNLVFTIALSGPSSQAVVVDFATVDGTAQSLVLPRDFLPTSGRLTFDPGVLTKKVTVPTGGDLLSEANEVFLLKLANPVGAFLSKEAGTALIVDNDPLPGLSIDDVSLAEPGGGDAPLVFTLQLAAVSGQSVTVAYTTLSGTASSPGDYTAQSGTLTWAPGQTVQKITVAVRDDPFPEPSETFSVVLSSPVGAALTKAAGTATITDTDPPGFVVSSTADEGPGSLRQAILDANARAGEDLVTFSFPGGAHTIALASPLPLMSGPLTFDVPAGARIKVGDGDRFDVRSSAAVSLVGGGTLALDGGRLWTKGLSIDSAAGTALDLADGLLVLDYTGGVSPLALIEQYLATGINLAGTNWDGAGIRSSAARDDAAFVTALGVVDNADIGYDTLDGHSFGYGLPGGELLPAEAVLIKFTYTGDADLNGRVDGDDLVSFLVGYAGASGGWGTGDFDYNGAVDGDDLVGLLYGYLNQGAPLAAARAAAAVSPLGAVTPATAPSASPAPAALSNPPGERSPAWTADALAPGHDLDEGLLELMAYDRARRRR